MPVLIDCSAAQRIFKLNDFKTEKLEYYDVNGCQGGNAYIAITVDGGVKPCSFWKESFCDAETMTQQEWLTNEKLVEFRKYQDNINCQKCEYEKLCHGGCRLEYLNCK